MNYDTIQTLLDLHEQILDQEDGYWIKIEAWRVDINPIIPHGIRYSLTLHMPNGERILGYDNAWDQSKRKKVLRSTLSIRS